MQDVFGDLTPRALVLYGLAGDGPSPKPDPVYGNTADQWGSDLFRCPAVVQGEWHSSAGNPTWEYQFDRAIPPNPRTAHSGDLPYVFGNLPTTGGMSGKYQDADRALSGTIQAYWTQFAKTGNPNGPGVATWPQYNGKTRKYLNFTAAAEVAVAENQRGAICDLFREALRKQAGSP
jgi:para-nitrobenzyl esterase